MFDTKYYIMYDFDKQDLQINQGSIWNSKETFKFDLNHYLHWAKKTDIYHKSCS